MTTIADVRAELEADPERWKLRLFRQHVSRPTGDGERVFIPPADHHREFWKWIWQIRLGESMKQNAFIGVWPRGGAKSTNAELAAAALGARRARGYCLYVCGTQDQADDHVGNVQALLEDPTFGKFYPEVGSRMIGSYGPRAWRRNRLQTASGFAVDAAGLDTAVRGMKLLEQRPDLMIIDDVDDVNDSASLSEKKLRTLTRSVLLAGAPSLVVIVIQNLVLRGGVIWHIVSNPAADILANGIISGPIPALANFKPDEHMIPNQEGRGWIIDGGEPTWVGQDVEACQAMVDLVGRDAFLTECQHSLDEAQDLVYPHFSLDVHRWIGKIPQKFEYLVGGLDFGGEGFTANHSAGIIGGVMEGGRVLLLSEFRERGVDIAARQMNWMQTMEDTWAEPIEWFADRTENTGIQLLRGSGFNIKSPLSGGEVRASRESRVRLVGQRLRTRPDGKPGLFYRQQLAEFENEALHYRRSTPPAGAIHDRRDIIRIDDHLMTATEYMIEGLDARRHRGDEKHTPAYAKVNW